jgi:uncharacterized protein (UPF0335 family)
MQATETSAPTRLQAFVARVRKVDEEARTNATRLKDIYAEARASGFDPKLVKLLARNPPSDFDESKYFGVDTFPSDGISAT